MHVLAPQLLLAISTACLATCSSNETILVDAPQALSADERNDFEVSKVRRVIVEFPYGEREAVQLTATGRLWRVCTVKWPMG